MKKLFHPLIPLFILLFLAGKYSYDTFFSEKYDEKTLSLLVLTKAAGESISSGYLSTNDKIRNLMKESFMLQGISKNEPKVVKIQSKLDTLQAIYQKYEKQIDSVKDIKILYDELKTKVTQKEFDNFPNQNYSIQNLNLQTLFTNYLKEIKAVDNFISDKYKNYVFEENQTDKELENKYLKGRKIEILIYLSSFKAELTQIYVQAVDTLVEEYSYYPYIDKFYKNAFYEPSIREKNNEYYVEIDKIAPFTTWRDTTELRSQIETNVKYYFKDGFLVIDEKDFDLKKLEWKWYLEEGSRETKKHFLEYGKEGFQYEK